MEEIKIKVNGMECAGCEKRLEGSLKELEGVEKVKADYKKKQVIIKMNKELNREIINQKIEDLGFEVSA